MLSTLQSIQGRSSLPAHATQAPSSSAIRPIKAAMPQLTSFRPMGLAGSSHRLASIKAEPERPVFLGDKARQVVKDHWHSLAQDLKNLKDEQTALLEEKGQSLVSTTQTQAQDRVDSFVSIIDDTRRWAGDVQTTAADAAPAYLKPDVKKDLAALASFADAIITIADGLDHTPNVLVLGGEQSPFYMGADLVADKANVMVDVPRAPVDVVVLDGLLSSKSPLSSEEMIKDAKELIPDHGFVVVINSHNPSRTHLNMSRHLLDAAKGQLFQQFGQVLKARLRQNGLAITSETKANQLQTIIAQKMPAAEQKDQGNMATKAIESSKSGLQKATDGLKALPERLSQMINPSDKSV